MSTSAPERSVDQRLAALALANDIRGRRAVLKRSLARQDRDSAGAALTELLEEPPSWLASARVLDIFIAVPKIGRVKAERIFNRCRISPSKTFGGMSYRQRIELIPYVNGEKRL